MDCCCCCFSSIPESSRTIDEHVPLSRAPPSSAASPEAEIRNLYSSPLSPPTPLAFSPRIPSPPPKLPTTLSNSSEGARAITQAQALPEKETWPDDDDDDLKKQKQKQDRETIDECPICLEEYESENPKLLTKCGHDFHLACILEWMERSEACPVCDKELVISES